MSRLTPEDEKDIRKYQQAGWYLGSSHAAILLVEIEALRKELERAREMIKDGEVFAGLQALTISKLRTELQESQWLTRQEVDKTHELIERLADKDTEIEIRALIIRTDKQRIADLERILQWLDRRGGLGLDVHERIRKVLTAQSQEPK